MKSIHSLLNNDVIPNLVQLEYSSFFQIPGLHLVGLPEREVNEAKERVRAALFSAGYPLPKRRILINLSPAHARKTGTGHDLAIALTILVHSHSVPTPIQRFKKIFAWGELSLDGTVKSVGQVARSLYAAARSQCDLLILPLEDKESSQQAVRLIQELLPQNTLPEVLWISHLKDLHSTAVRPLSSQRSVPSQEVSPPPSLLPLSSNLERIIGLAAAGRHHLCLLGPKGVGKSYALKWLELLQPAPQKDSLLQHASFLELRERSPALHLRSTITRRVGSMVRPAALYGQVLRNGEILPGEFSLADGGLLIADELPEWPRDSIEAFRESLQSKQITLSRSKGSLTLPANFVLGATGNLCPCGGLPPQWVSTGSTGEAQVCECTTNARYRYLQKISGPVLDRMDLIYKINPKKKSHRPCAPQETKRYLDHVREVQSRLKTDLSTLPGDLTDEATETLTQEMKITPILSEEFPNQSLRARHKIFKIALTIAAWEKKNRPDQLHLYEASLYRQHSL